jgi:hypothetical protein
MKCELNCTNPEEIEYTITMTATAKEWEMIRDIMNIKTDIVLTSTISSMLKQANRTFRGEE